MSSRAPELIFHDAKSLPAAFGLGNSGAQCYLNSLMQLLFSCTAFVRHASPMVSRAIRAQSTRAIQDHLVKISSRRKPGAKTNDHIDYGQQSADDAFRLLIEDADFGNEEMRADFGLTIRTHMRCRSCRWWHALSTDHFMLPAPYVKSEDVNGDDQVLLAALNGDSFVPEGHICGQCGANSQTEVQHAICRVSTIILISFNQYDMHTQLHLPRNLAIKLHKGIARFLLVGTAVHSGRLEGGHYFARGIREDGQWYMLNDTTAHEQKMHDDVGTYLAAYHLEKIE